MELQWYKIPYDQNNDLEGAPKLSREKGNCKAEWALWLRATLFTVDPFKILTRAALKGSVFMLELKHNVHSRGAPCDVMLSVRCVLF